MDLSHVAGLPTRQLYPLRETKGLSYHPAIEKYVDDERTPALFMSAIVAVVYVLGMMMGVTAIGMCSWVFVGIMRS